MAVIEDCYERLPVIPPIALFGLLAVAGYLFSWLDLRWKTKAPLVGLKTPFDLRVVANWHVFMNLGAILDDGYARFKNQIFRFARNDCDMIVVPNKYIEEIRALPMNVANPKAAHVHNLLGPYTNMDLIMSGDLHFRSIQTKLTPNLASLAAPMRDELKHAVNMELPDCRDQWTTIKPYHVILHMVARLSARVFVGLPIARNEEWLEISTQFTENVFVTLLAMRVFPTWMHPFIAPFIPPRWKLHNYIKRAQKLLVPEIKRRQAAYYSGQGEKESRSLLQWMIESADTAEEQDPNFLAHLETIISLASIHTSQMNAVHVMYDLAAHPEYLEPLRQEIRTVAAEPGGWNKSSYGKLRKLDSFLRESQRFNPPSILAYHRIMQDTAILSDGTILPRGSHIAMAVNKIQNDADVTPEPEKFDPFRYERMRSRAGEGHLHQFATAEPNKLNFGYGKYACPGRFFAALEIKTILVELIMNYDVKLLDGCNRPENLRAYEFIFPNPDVEVQIRARPVEEQMQLDVAE
ncbi:uncharacterized protein PFLUO_LOCUS1388 [Penicillium psychrofluorescens]|uniref:uncharacterized protein n=1 Tax=Penicillium psychrofluorescens TaxID=3158075 RepID=UPI003CCE5372